jgi:protein involved in polysaccharide export with SLBB domain
MTSGRVTVDTTIRVIADTVGVTAGLRINARNRGAVPVYLGASDVTTATGYQLDPGDSVSSYIENGEELYGVAASSSAIVHVLKGGA